MTPWFGFLMKIAVVTYRGFSCYRVVLTQSYGLFYFLCYPANGKAGDTQGAGRGHN